MRNKDDKDKKRRQKKLVNVISNLAKKRWGESHENVVVEDEENVPANVIDLEADNNGVDVFDEPLSSRRSKRKPEKTSKVTSEQLTIDLSNHEEDIVKSSSSDDEFEDSPEEVDNQIEDKLKQKGNPNANNSKENNDMPPLKVKCTACNEKVFIKGGKFCRHPDLNTVICKKCYKFYSSGKFTKDEYGVEEFCRWCADGGELICCDFCEKAFCKKCISRNVGRNKLVKLLKADESEKWSCFCCDPTPISELVELCDEAMRVLDKKKAQTSPYKVTKGRGFINAPSISERRNILTTLLPRNAVTSKVDSNSTKKDSKNFDKEISPSKETINTKKEQSDDMVVKKELEDDGNKTIVLTVESTSEDDRQVSDQDVKNDEAKTTVKDGENAETDSDGPPKKRGNKKKKPDDHVDSSSGEELSHSKKNNRGNKGKRKSKSARKGFDSDSEDDPVSLSCKKKGKRNRRARTSSNDVTNEVTDEDETTESSESDTSEASVKRKKTRGEKRMRQLSQSTDTESESDVVSSPKNRLKKKNVKGKIKGKWRLRGKHSDSSCSDFDFEDARKKKSRKKVDKKKKSKIKRKRKIDYNDDDESDEENVSPSKKGRRKIRKILDDEKLAEATRHARQLEEERRQRLLEKTKNTEFQKPQTFHVKELVLEYEPDGKTPLVEVQQDLIEHLKPHQVEGVKFMYDCTVESVERWKKNEEGGGCILAHVMGLGKTLQVVTLVHTLYRSNLIQLRRVLVVCPLNTVLNWQVEFEKWLSVDDRLDVFVLNEVKSGNWDRADMLNNWMKHGGILIMGYHMYRSLSQCARIKSKHQKKIYQESLVDPGPELVVCDEGHVLRNYKTALSISMNKIKTKRRIVLTGTPLQNNLVEYHCMASFVKPNLLGTLKEFSNSFIRPIENGQCADSTVADVQLMKRRCHVLHKMLEGCIQRKDYSEIQRFLPPKFEYVIKIRLAEKQREMYKYYLETFLSTEEGVKGRGGSLFADYQALMRIWTHPWSLKLETEFRRTENFVDTDTDGSLKDFIDDDESAMSSEEMSWTSDNNSSDNDNGEESQEKKNRKSVSEEKEENNGDEQTTPSKGKQRAEKQSDRKETEKKIKIEPSGPSTSKDSLVDNDDDVIEVKPPVNEKANSGKKVMVSSTLRSGFEFKEAAEMNEVQEEEVEIEQEWYDQFLTEEDETNVELGSKIVLLLEILADAAALEEKVIVFSHSLISLDVIEMALGGGEIGGNTEDWCRGCDYFRMDGSTTAQMRKRWADIFNDEENKEARLFLISTKAGGLGINMVGASRVIVFDVSWNPSHDVQSIFRAYRFGQNKPVFVYRFISQGTMEEKIYDRQVTKLSMSQRVVDERQIQRHFNATDLAELYRFEPDVLKNENEERPTPAVPKDAVLAELINRLYPKWIVKYHEHDSLLQNRPEEELTEAERKEAWDQWELEKQGILNPPQLRVEQVPQMANGSNIRPNIVFIDATTRNPNVRPSYVSVPPRPNAPTFIGQNFQQIFLEEQRRRLFEMDKRRREEQQRLARDSLLRLQQQEQQRQRLLEEQKRVEEEKKQVEQQLRQQAEKRQREQQQREQQQREQQRRFREQQQREQQQREQQQREQQQREQQQREQQRQRRFREQQQQQEEQKRRQEQQQQQQMGQQFLQQLLRNRNAYVSRQTRAGQSNQSVFQVVVDNNVNNNPTRRSQRSQRSPPRIIELPPDA